MYIYYRLGCKSIVFSCPDRFIFWWVLKSVWNYASQIPTTLAAPAAVLVPRLLSTNEYALEAEFGTKSTPKSAPVGTASPSQLL